MDADSAINSRNRGQHARFSRSENGFSLAIPMWTPRVDFCKIVHYLFSFVQRGGIGFIGPARGTWPARASTLHRAGRHFHVKASSAGPMPAGTAMFRFIVHPKSITATPKRLAGALAVQGLQPYPAPGGQPA